MSFNKVIIEKMAYSLPPHIVSFEEIEENLAPIYERLNLQAGRLEINDWNKGKKILGYHQQASQSSAKPVLNYLKKEISIPMKLIC